MASSKLVLPSPLLPTKQLNFSQKSIEIVIQKIVENFSIKKDGLHFYYNHYEIGCYAMGIPDVTISWKQLSKLNP